MNDLRTNCVYLNKRVSYMYDSTLLDMWRLLLAAFSATVENHYT